MRLRFTPVHRHVISAVLRGAHKKKDSSFSREVARSDTSQVVVCRLLSGRGLEANHEALLPFAPPSAGDLPMYRWLHATPHHAAALRIC